jgi:hypothetical protein
MSLLNILSKVVIAGIAATSNQMEREAVQSEEARYWNGRMSINLDRIDRLEKIESSFKFGSDWMRAQQKNSLENKCAELRNAVRRAALEKCHSRMDRTERDIKTAEFFAR